jgi:hypothetical protein
MPRQLETDDTLTQLSNSDRRAKKQPNTNKKRLRFNLLILVLVWTLVAIPLLMPRYSLSFTCNFVVCIVFFVDFALTLALIVSAQTLFKLFQKKYKRPEKYTKVTEQQLDRLCHIVTICIYKEPLNLIEKTIESLAKQSQSHRLIVVVAMQQKTPEADWKESVIKMKFGYFFDRLVFTRYPSGIIGDIAGKCSNLNYAGRSIVQLLKDTNELRLENTTFTSCDSDNLFHPDYFELLGVEFIMTRHKHRTVWQSPLFYNWQLDSSPWFTRITGLFRPIFMMGFLIPLNINPMSVFSMSVELYIKGNYTHPGYHMDDIISVIRWMTEVRGHITVQPIYVPTLSGPTSGATFREEFCEWQAQARRWTIGAAEVFHYYCVRFFSIPLATAISWGLCFTSYYFIFLCAAPIICIIGSLIPFIYPEASTIVVVGGQSFSSMMLILGIYQQLCFLSVFLLNFTWTKLMDIKERVSLLNNLLHLVLSPFTFVAYAIVEFIALHEIAIYGKSVCTHDPAKKQSLANRDIRH